jgi:periodic tryptophan protein 2
LGLDGFACIVNAVTEAVLNHFNFKGNVGAIAFSNDSKFLACGVEKNLRVFERPPNHHHIEPLLLLKKYTAIHSEPITALEFSPDSRFVISASKDLTIRLTNLFTLPNFIPYVLSGHRDKILSLLVWEDFSKILSISRDGHVFVWKWVDDHVSKESQAVMQYSRFKKGARLGMEVKPAEELEEEVFGKEKKNERNLMSKFELEFEKGRWILEKRHQIKQAGSKMKTAYFHRVSKMLLIGFSNGLFGLYRMNKDSEIETIQSFSITTFKITSVSISKDGSWLAFGSKINGSLMVWEWRSQTFIFNQEGLSYNVKCIDFSPEGRFMATGGQEGVLRLWDTTTFLCFSSFRDHESAITGVKFTNRNHSSAPVVISASLDGTVRAYDTVRYRNFRTMKPDTPAQFHCVDIDKSGDIIAAGSFDPYHVYLWSLQTGSLLDVLAGHDGPITCMAFSYNNVLATGSWDKTVRVHDVLTRKTREEIYDHESSVTSLAFRPDGKELCVTTRNLSLGRCI